MKGHLFLKEYLVFALNAGSRCYSLLVGSSTMFLKSFPHETCLRVAKNGKLTSLVSRFKRTLQVLCLTIN